MQHSLVLHAATAPSACRCGKNTARVRKKQPVPGHKPRTQPKQRDARAPSHTRAQLCCLLPHNPFACCAAPLLVQACARSAGCARRLRAQPPAALPPRAHTAHTPSASQDTTSRQTTPSPHRACECMLLSATRTSLGAHRLAPKRFVVSARPRTPSQACMLLRLVPKQSEATHAHAHAASGVSPHHSVCALNGGRGAQGMRVRSQPTNQPPQQDSKHQAAVARCGG
jgi:hypothetical protein